VSNAGAVRDPRAVRSGSVSPITRRRVAGVAAAVLGTLLWPPTALAQPDPDPGTDPQISQAAGAEPEELHNIIYRARIDGVSRGATISYAAQGDRTEVATPTMVPGRVFEANTVLPASGTATVRVAIEWPYSANLHCEILVDDQLVAQADDFVAPRVLPQRDDPDYGSITCQAPVSGVESILPPELAVPPEAPGPADPPAPAETAGHPDIPAPPPVAGPEA